MKSYLLLAGLLASCSGVEPPVTKVYYNDSSQVDDGEIWGSTLDLFFTDTTVTVSRSESQILAEELLNVKQLLTQEVPDLTIDYLPYSYAFITASRDTFYADRKLSTWRYKRQRLTGKNALVNLGARH